MLSNGSDLGKAVDILQDSESSCEIKVQNDPSVLLGYLNYMPEGVQFILIHLPIPHIANHPLSIYSAGIITFLYGELFVNRPICFNHNQILQTKFLLLLLLLFSFYFNS